jgi:hypothetical protein
MTIIKSLIAKTDRQIDLIHNKLKLQSDFAGMFASSCGKYQGYKTWVEKNNEPGFLKFNFTKVGG